MLIIVAVALAVLIGLLVFGIDMPRKMTAGSELRAALDAAALAAVNQLDGTPDGFGRAEAAAKHVIGLNKIHGARVTEPDATFGFYGKVLCARHPQTCTAGGCGCGRDAACEACRQANPRVPEIYLFQPLGSDYEKRLEYQGIPGAAVANAVQLSAEATVSGAFTSVFGALNAGTVSAVSAAVADQIRDECVFPLAVPACSLFLDTEKGSEQKGFSLGEYDSGIQCGRDLVFTEAGLWDSNEEYYSRLHGLLRYDFLNPLPEVDFKGDTTCIPSGGRGPDCRKVMLQGTFALPLDRGINASAAAEPREIIDAFGKLASGKPCIENVALGTALKPLQNGVEQGFGIMDNQGNREELRLYLRRLLTPSPGGDPDMTNFRVFLDGNDVPKHPFLRGGGTDAAEPTMGVADLTVRWPSFGDSEKILLSIPQHHALWTNPFCHDPAIPANVPTAPVLKITVMAIAADVPAGGYRYCQFPNQFSQVAVNMDPNTVAPGPWTNPYVVGFVTAYIYDFNFDNLSETFAADEMPKWKDLGVDYGRAVGLIDAGS